MIPRYSRPQMAAIWEPANKFRIWFEIEAHACDAQAQLGVIPKEAAETVWAKGNIPYDGARIDRIDEIERETKHDVIAFTTELAEQVGDDARFVHQGMTSSDVLDTCLAVQLKQAATILLDDIDRVLEALKTRAMEHKLTPVMGRSHGIHAEPTTVGLKLARFYAEFQRARWRLENARDEIATCAISGAVGTFANIDPFVEEYVADKMGLSPEPISTQVIPRDRHAMFFATLGVVAASMENLATEIRHMQRTEVREAQEYFAPGQKGSSAMPHKRNPILTENLTGLARLVRMAVVPALENVALWHERDISHSSVERMIGPDATVTLDFALARLAGVVEKLVIYPANMKEHIDKFGGIHDAQRVLLFLTQKGVSREDAYRIVQRAAMRVWKSFGIDPDDPDKPAHLDAEDEEAQSYDNRLMFFLEKDDQVKQHLKPEELEALFEVSSLDYHSAQVETVFRRVFSE
ncbi:MAG: adenylosuccinate lyase [Rhodospirillaceae bacterium]|nr:adenylosuccinate lyase [Rhodospirillaceae bacterium]